VWRHGALPHCTAVTLAAGGAAACKFVGVSGEWEACVCLYIDVVCARSGCVSMSVYINQQEGSSPRRTCFGDCHR